MENFRTAVKIERAPFSIGYAHKVMSLGSCFAGHIGNKLQYFGFSIDLNPFGIIYNLLSILASLQRLIDKQPFTEADLFYHNEIWQSYAHHGDFADPDKNKALEGMNKRLEAASNMLTECRVLILTFGTAYAYFLKETGIVVANCHKMPDSLFERRLLRVEEIVSAMTEVLKKLNPDIQVILTVSPVRHLKDGAHGNQLSKATLLLAVHKLVAHYSNCHYFPAYELMLDDLRDYRFYNEDMVHPNSLAIDYIWDKFSATYLNQEAAPIMEKVAALRSAAQHRPRNAQSQAHQQFLEKNLAAVMALQDQYGIQLPELEAYFYTGNP